MLKKLAKYGNSTALVIDKAILELLEIDDATMVKLHTDGKSLIVTPVKAGQVTGKVFYGLDEAVGLATMTNYEGFKAMNLSLEQKQQITKESQMVVEKYDGAVKNFLQIHATTEFKALVSRISEKYDPVTQVKEYSLEYNKIRYQFVPELEKMDQELEAITKKYTLVQ